MIRLANRNDDALVFRVASGVTSGAYHHTFDTTVASTYNSAFITASGDIVQAQLALFSATTSGRAYLNIHSTVFAGGEIRGFLLPVPEPATLLLFAAAGITNAIRMRRRHSVKTAR